ncbi:MAG: hypothetical protein OXG92_01385 [Chloroflexi bacterium]|nr:hypothetical protein [Chloroflexota bacterium]MCY3583103.1 hypothetical protein [Chloroflexota bacterium]MCY3715107.1 hypothetical protein [Chloroflexota bacterium]MDE2651067.1 hypothetical protein [Chloroflexota bacterium]MXV93920.1 hypothetical protein [Chloroflexota bacterium]
MTHTITRIGFVSTVKIAAIVSALAAALPVGLLLLLNNLFQFWDVYVPPDALAPLLAQMAVLGALAGGISTALTVMIYNFCAPIFGGVTLHLKAQHPPRKRKSDDAIP